MITAAIIGGLAGLWVWTVLNDEDGILGFLNQWLAKWSVTNKWMTCPWCSGAWFSITASVIIYHPTIPSAIVTGLAASAVCGLIAMYVGD